MILRAMKHTKSNMAAARFLGCSYPHYKQYAKLYKNEEGQTLFEVRVSKSNLEIGKAAIKRAGHKMPCGVQVVVKENPKK